MITKDRRANIFQDLEITEEEERLMTGSNLRRRLHVAERFLNGQEISSILDVGCGRGIIGGYMLRRYMCKVVGIDIFQDDPESDLKSAVKRGLDVKKVDINVETFPYPDDTFDAVLFLEVIEHLRNYHHALNEINRVLRRGGVLVLSTPNMCKTSNILRLISGKGILPLESRDKHLWLFSYDQIKTLLIMHGFKPQNVVYVNYPPRGLFGYVHKNVVCHMVKRLGDIISVKASKVKPVYFEGSLESIFKERIGEDIEMFQPKEG